jgi:hypothetical protein
LEQVAQTARMLSPQKLATVWAPAGLDMIVAASCNVAKPGYYSEWRCAKAQRRATRRAARSAARMQRRAARRNAAGPAPVEPCEIVAPVAPIATTDASYVPVSDVPTASYVPASDSPGCALVVAKAL